MCRDKLMITSPLPFRIRFAHQFRGRMAPDVIKIKNFPEKGGISHAPPLQAEPHQSCLVSRAREAAEERWFLVGAVCLGLFM